MTTDQSQKTYFGRVIDSFRKDPTPLGYVVALYVGFVLGADYKEREYARRLAPVVTALNSLNDKLDKTGTAPLEKRLEDH